MRVPSGGFAAAILLWGEASEGAAEAPSEAKPAKPPTELPGSVRPQLVGLALARAGHGGVARVS